MNISTSLWFTYKLHNQLKSRIIFAVFMWTQSLTPLSFEWLEFAFKCFESHSNGSNLYSNASNPFWIVRICIWMLRISFEWLAFALECFGSLSNGSNLHLSASNPFQMVRTWIQMLPISFEWLKFALECSETLSNGSNLHLNASNPFHMFRIWLIFWEFLKTGKEGQPCGPPLDFAGSNGRGQVLVPRSPKPSKRSHFAKNGMERTEKGPKGDVFHGPNQESSGARLSSLGFD